MKSKERAKLEKLQKEYNDLHERMGYCYNERTIRAINNSLDEISQKMNEIFRRSSK